MVLDGGVVKLTQPNPKYSPRQAGATAGDVVGLRAILGLSNRLIPAEGKGILPNKGIFLDSETLWLFLLLLFFRVSINPGFSSWESQKLPQPRLTY